MEDKQFLVNADQSDVRVQNLRNAMYPQIAKHEGVKKAVYTDSVGKPTIGIGFNLADPVNQEILAKEGIDHNALIKGKQSLSDEQIRSLYERSFINAYRDAKAFLPDLDKHPEAVQKAVIDMAFNMGRPTLMGFKKTRKAFQDRNYQAAADEMLDSLWAEQVGDRATSLANMVRRAKR